MSGATDLSTLSSNSTTLASNAALQTAAQQALAQRAMSGVPSTATPFHDTNTTDVSDTTVRTVRAAVTSKKKWITEVTYTNKTAAETPVIILQDDTGTPIVLDTTSLGAGGGVGGSVYKRFEPPIEVAAGKAITAKATSSVGDTLVTVGGFEQA